MIKFLKYVIPLLILVIFFACNEDEEVVHKVSISFDSYMGIDIVIDSVDMSLEPTGFFQVAEIDGLWWFITPEGNPFFSQGVNVVNINGTSTYDGVKHYREAVDSLYESEEEWAAAQKERMAEWGFNTIGAWSSYELFADMCPLIVLLNIASGWTGGDIPDYFSDDFVSQVNQNAIDRTADYIDNPYVIGYFLNNELKWGTDWRPGGDLMDGYFTLDSTAKGKETLVNFLKEQYSDFDDFSADFSTNAQTWDELLEETSVSNNNDASAQDTRSAWDGIVAEQYFSVTSEAIKNADPNHLNIGARFIPYFVPEAVLKAAMKYIDVVSVNYYDLLEDLEFTLYSFDPHYLKVEDYMQSFYDVAGKPMLISEWSYRAVDSGLPNTYPPIFPILNTQTERAHAFTTYMNSVLSKNYFIGAHWFLYTDQPDEGRFDGEDNNFGLVTEDDEPYEILIEHSTAVYEEIYLRYFEYAGIQNYVIVDQ